MLQKSLRKGRGTHDAARGGSWQRDNVPRVALEANTSVDPLKACRTGHSFVCILVRFLQWLRKAQKNTCVPGRRTDDSTVGRAFIGNASTFGEVHYETIGTA